MVNKKKAVVQGQNGHLKKSVVRFNGSGTVIAIKHQQKDKNQKRTL